MKQNKQNKITFPVNLKPLVTDTTQYSTSGYLVFIHLLIFLVTWAAISLANVFLLHQ